MKKVIINYKDLSKKEKVFYWIRKVLSGIVYFTILIALTVCSVYSLLRNSDDESSVLCASAEATPVDFVADIKYTVGVYYDYLDSSTSYSVMTLNGYVEDDDYNNLYFSRATFFLSYYGYFVDYCFDIEIISYSGDVLYEDVHVVDYDLSSRIVTFDTDIEISSNCYCYIRYCDYYFTYFDYGCPIYVSDDVDDGYVYVAFNFSYLKFDLYVVDCNYPLTMYVPTCFLCSFYDFYNFGFTYNGSTGDFVGGLYTAFFDYDIADYFFFVCTSRNGYDYYTGVDALYYWASLNGYDFEAYNLDFYGFVGDDYSTSLSLNIEYLGDDDFYIDFNLGFSDIPCENVSSTYYETLSSSLLSGSVTSLVNAFVADTDYYYNLGYSDGSTSGYSDGYAVGVQDGYAKGELDGYDDGYYVGYIDGYYVGIIDGEAGYDYAEGYSVGLNFGYSLGYTDGYSLGQSELWSSPVYTLIEGVADIMEVKLFGYFSLASICEIGLYIFVALMAIKLFT